MDASVRWVSGLTFLGRSSSGHSIALGSRSGPDDPGAGGPSPMELILLGLGGCTGIDVISILEKKRQPVTGFSIEIHAERAEEHPRVFSKIELEYVFTGGPDPKAVEDAIRLSRQKYCSVSAMIAVSAEIIHRVRIEP